MVHTFDRPTAEQFNTFAQYYRKTWCMYPITLKFSLLILREDNRNIKHIIIRFPISLPDYRAGGLKSCRTNDRIPTNVCTFFVVLYYTVHVQRTRLNFHYHAHRMICSLTSLLRSKSELSVCLQIPLGHEKLIANVRKK